MGSVVRVLRGGGNCRRESDCRSLHAKTAVREDMSVPTWVYGKRSRKGRDSDQSPEARVSGSRLPSASATPHPEENHCGCMSKEKKMISICSACCHLFGYAITIHATHASNTCTWLARAYLCHGPTAAAAMVMVMVSCSEGSCRSSSETLTETPKTVWA